MDGADSDGTFERNGHHLDLGCGLNVLSFMPLVYGSLIKSDYGFVRLCMVKWALEELWESIHTHMYLYIGTKILCCSYLCRCCC